MPYSLICHLVIARSLLGLVTNGERERERELRSPEETDVNEVYVRSTPIRCPHDKGMCYFLACDVRPPSGTARRRPRPSKGREKVWTKTTYRIQRSIKHVIWSWLEWPTWLVFVSSSLKFHLHAYLIATQLLQNHLLGLMTVSADHTKWDV